MAPDDIEPAPALELSQRFPLPAEARRPFIRPADGCDGSVRRIYDVFRVDGPHRRLAVLIVTDSHLRWLDVQHGGVLELLPAWLEFVPCVRIDGAFSQQLVQRAARPRPTMRVTPGLASVGRDPFDSLELIVEGPGAGGLPTVCAWSSADPR